MSNLEVNCLHLHFISLSIVCNKTTGAHIAYSPSLKYPVTVSTTLTWSVYIKHALIQIWFYYCVLPEFTEGIGSTGSSVAFGHNTTDSPLRINVGGEGVVGADGAV